MRALTLPAFPCSRAKLPHGVSYIFPPPRPFSPACSPPPSCFLARALQSRAQRDRCCARVVARLPHPSGNKPRRQNWANLCTEKAGYILTPPRFTSAESFSSCCGSVAALALFFDSVAALALASCNEHVAEASVSQPHPPTPRVLCTVPNPKFIAREVGETT
jgi:hypothetical protein